MISSSLRPGESDRQEFFNRVKYENRDRMSLYASYSHTVFNFYEGIKFEISEKRRTPSDKETPPCAAIRISAF